MRASSFIGTLLVGLVFVAACDDTSGNPTSTAAKSQAGAPVINSITATDTGNGIVTLRVKATDPNNSQLSYYRFIGECLQSSIEINGFRSSNSLTGFWAKYSQDNV